MMAVGNSARFDVATDVHETACSVWACSVGRTTRSQNPDIIAKQKSFMHKYQIAVKSPLMEYVRNAAADDAQKAVRCGWKRGDVVCLRHVPRRL